MSRNETPSTKPRTPDRRPGILAQLLARPQLQSPDLWRTWGLIAPNRRIDAALAICGAHS